jgi:hypothetical protein
MEPWFPNNRFLMDGACHNSSLSDFASLLQRIQFISSLSHYLQCCANLGMLPNRNIGHLFWDCLMHHTAIPNYHYQRDDSATTQIAGNPSWHVNFQPFSWFAPPLVVDLPTPDVYPTQKRFSTSTSASFFPNVGTSTQLTTPDCTPEELQLFARTFKKRRIELGYTQGEVVLSLQKDGVDIAQPLLSRFEMCTLSSEVMSSYKPFLQKWLNSVLEVKDQSFVAPRAQLKNYETLRKKRKKRTHFSGNLERVLTWSFEQNSRPTNETCAALAHMLELSTEVVRCWFRNRRQRLKMKIH